MPKILVVDDSAVDRCYVGALAMSEPGVEVVYAENGREALETLERDLPDILITDMMMPQMNGLELVTAARTRFPQLPIILMTSQGNEEIAVEALHRGAASYVSKNLLAQKLIGTIQELYALSCRAESQTRVMRYLVGASRRFVLENDPSLFVPLVACLQEEAIRFGLGDDGDRMRIGIALQEALVNALYHGNLEVDSSLKDTDDRKFYAQIESRLQTPPYCDRRIFVDADLTHDQLRITIRDEGRGFDPHGLPDPTDPQNLERSSGRGVLLMRTFMDEIHFNEHGNAVTLIKYHPFHKREGISAG